MEITECGTAGRRESPSRPIGRITLEVKHPGKPGAGNQHAGFDVAGAGTVTMGVGLRPTPKGVDGPPTPTVGAPVLDPTDEGALVITDCCGSW